VAGWRDDRKARENNSLQKIATASNRLCVVRIGVAAREPVLTVFTRWRTTQPSIYSQYQ